MQPDFILTVGAVICGITLISTIGAIILLRYFKVRLNKQLDAEFGKKRH